MDRGMHFTRDATMCRSGLLVLLLLTGMSILSDSTHAQEAALPPDDSEYIIFIIDTSGSMFNHVWPMMLEKVEETLNLYPKVKGFQVMNDEGGTPSRIPARSRASSRPYVPITTLTRRSACTCSVTSSRGPRSTRP
jgi:hypothetical protein